MSNFEPTLQEVVGIIEEINMEMPEELYDLGISPLTVLVEPLCGFYVKAFGTCIWSEENDCRDYLVDEHLGEVDEKADLKEYLKCEMGRICNLIMLGVS